MLTEQETVQMSYETLKFSPPISTEVLVYMGPESKIPHIFKLGTTCR